MIFFVLFLPLFAIIAGGFFVFFIQPRITKLPCKKCNGVCVFFHSDVDLPGLGGRFAAVYKCGDCGTIYLV